MQAMHVLVLHNLLVFLQLDRKEREKKPTKNVCVFQRFDIRDMALPLPTIAVSIPPPLLHTPSKLLLRT